MPKLRMPAQRDYGVHLARLITFSAALAAITGIIVADLTASEADEPAAMALALVDDDATPADRAAEGEVPVMLAAEVAVPDAPEIAAPEPAPVKKKKQRKSKLNFGRFEGY
jgi:hypothetical protein